jgi:AmmeMemoRadiSam system protein B
VGVSAAETLETPVGSLSVDAACVERARSLLEAAGVPVKKLSLREDGEEHSSEMMYPFVSLLLRRHSAAGVKVVPLMVGAASPEVARVVGETLSPLLFAPSTFVVVSSDFCHWGVRFRYQPFLDPPPGATVGQLITQLDREGMSEIESLRPGGFADYLERTRNTICGRHPIEVLLHAASGGGGVMRWLRYEKSGEVEGAGDSSVSYAAGVLYRGPTTNEE